ncbi:MAG: alpha-ribazole phosphatase family protein [Spirochaetales bacterium]|nr:alpha-ribazole phosphatase family protein [Spirochaetales bacterium]
MDFYCLRHPRPDIEPATCYGQRDIPLNTNYQMELQRLFPEISALVNSGKISCIYTSPLSRCKEPAAFISKAFHLPFKVDPLLMEISFGEWEGKSFDELWAKDSNYQNWCSNWKSARPPGGESLSDLLDRAGNFIKNNSLNNSLIITHSGLIRSFYHILYQKKISDFFNPNPNFGSLIYFENI